MCVFCFTKFKIIILVFILSQGISQMAISLLSSLSSPSPCGWPPLDSGHRATQGFRFNMSDLWLRQPRQEFTEIFRNRGVYLMDLIELGKICHITFLNFPTCLKRTN